MNILLALLDRRQGSDVLLDVLAYESLVEVTDDGECEVSCVCCALLCNLQDAVVVHVVDVLLFERVVPWVVCVEGILQRVAQCALRRECLVLQSHLVLVEQIADGLLVLLDVGEVEVVHLEHCLHVLRCTVARGILVELAQVEVHVGVLSGENLLQLSAAEVAQSAVCDDSVEEFEVHTVLQVVE